MSPGNLSDGDLLSKIRSLAVEERKLTTQVLELLREVERRRLFARQGFSSLFEYAVKELGYSEASASRRINSMRLLKDVPSVATLIEGGSLNLSTVSAVQCFLKREERVKGKIYSPEEKQDLLGKMENRSHRECEKILFQLSPEVAKSKETSRTVSPTQTELKLVVSDDLMQKIEKIKGLLAHSHPGIGLSGLLEVLVDRALEQIDPARKAARREKLKRKSDGKREPATPTSESPNERPASRYIPAAIRKEVWLRDGGVCSYVSPETGKKCESHFGLECDPILPFSQGGRSELSNLRLLCRTHNSWEAIQKIGAPTMGRYLRL